MSYLVEIKNLVKHFPLKKTWPRSEEKVVRAVDGVDLNIKKGQILGLAGESGCGKTTTARLAIRLIEPTAGAVHFHGQDIFKLGKKNIRKLRTNMQMIFQDPSSALNPRKTVRQILTKPFKVHGALAKDEYGKKALEALEVIGLVPTESFIDKHPHELSGGERQRVVIARAIALSPEFIVADEPVSFLDVSVQAQILNLIKKIKEESEIAFLFITHNLSVLRSISDTVAIMHLGKIVELADVEDLYTMPLHPYTKAIISATPIPNPRSARSRKRIILKGDVPSPIDPPSGCRFHTRCPYRIGACAKESPELLEVGTNHFVACLLHT